MRISLLTKYLLTMLAVALFTVGPVTILAVRGFLRDKSLDVFDRNNLIARNIASESQDELSGAASKMRLFAGVYLDPAIPAAKRVDIARNMFAHYGEFVRLSIVFDQAGSTPIRVYNRGGNAALSVAVEVTGTVGGDEEVSELTVDVLAGGSEVELLAGFSARPDADVAIRIVGLETP